MKVAIVGSASLSMESRAIARRHIRRVLKHYRVTLLVSGGAPGVDSIAEDVARSLGVAVRVYTPEVKRWDGGDRVGFKQRNMQIANDCDRLVRIASRNSQTYGSGWTRDYAASRGVPCEEIMVP